MEGPISVVNMIAISSHMALRCLRWWRVDGHHVVSIHGIQAEVLLPASVGTIILKVPLLQ